MIKSLIIESNLLIGRVIEFEPESCLPYFLQLVLLEKVCIEVDFGNCGKIMSPSDFTIAARTHARVQYSSPVLIVVHFESVRLKKMSRTLENLAEMMSPTYFEIVAIFHKRLPNALLAQILLQLDALEKEYVEFDVGRIVN